MSEWVTGYTDVDAQSVSLSLPLSHSLHNNGPPGKKRRRRSRLQIMRASREQISSHHFFLLKRLPLSLSLLSLSLSLLNPSFFVIRDDMKKDEEDEEKLLFLIEGLWTQFCTPLSLPFSPLMCDRTQRGGKTIEKMVIIHACLPSLARSLNADQSPIIIIVFPGSPRLLSSSYFFPISGIFFPPSPPIFTRGETTINAHGKLLATQTISSLDRAERSKFNFHIRSDLPPTTSLLCRVSRKDFFPQWIWREKEREREREMTVYALLLPFFPTPKFSCFLLLGNERTHSMQIWAKKVSEKENEEKEDFFSSSWHATLLPAHWVTHAGCAERYSGVQIIGPMCTFKRAGAFWTEIMNENPSDTKLPAFKIV